MNIAAPFVAVMALVPNVTPVLAAGVTTPKPHCRNVAVNPAANPAGTVTPTAALLLKIKRQPLSAEVSKRVVPPTVTGVGQSTVLPTVTVPLGLTRNSDVPLE